MTNFDISDPIFNDITKKHLIKIYKEKSMLKARREEDMENEMLKTEPNIIRLVK